MLARARELRQTRTEAEHTLWQHLRNRKLHGLKFRRQRPETSYVTDFYCDAAKVVVELDGITHIGKEAEDNQRDQTLTKNGYLVLRFENWQIWEEGRLVLDRIAEVCLERVKRFGVADRVHDAVPRRERTNAGNAPPSPATPPHPCPLPEGEGGRGVPKSNGSAILILLTALLLSSCTANPSTSPPRVASLDDPATPQVSAVLSSDLARTLPSGEVASDKASPLLRLTRIEPNGQEGPAVFGSYQRDGNLLVFAPAFQLSPGQKYRATLTLPGQQAVHSDYSVTQAAHEPPPVVERVFPASENLPANLLKFYIHFSKPMRQTDAIFDQLHILGAQDEPVPDPWRRFPQWSDDGKRLTLWIHPGRVKRGVNLREEIGPVLVPGQKYRLVIDAAVEDLAGNPLGKSFSKEFTATAEVHSRIALKDWKLELPKSGTREPLVISFPKPLDAALLQRLITIQEEDGIACEGNISVVKDETSWTFQPKFDWTNRDYRVNVDPLLEDLAGNTPVRVFDSEMGKDDAGNVELTIPFRAR